MSILIFILLLIGLILVHEWGHFLAAKLFKIPVEEFGVGFPPRLFSYKWGGTVYSFNALLFGGFVRIFGESSLDEKAAGDPRSFSNRSKWVQAAVVVAGVLFNFIFAWLALSVGYMVGLPTIGNGSQALQNVRATVVQVIPESPAAKAGFEAGDVIEGMRAGDEALPENAAAQETRGFIAAHPDENLQVTVRRGDSQQELSARPESGVVEGRAVLGVLIEDVGILRLSPPAALMQGGYLTFIMTRETAQGLWSFFSDLVLARADWNGVAGPVGIARVGGSAVESGLTTAILLIAVISINLGIINLVPIPGLDGGRLLLIAVEGVTGRALSPRISVALMVAGFALLIGLMVLVTYHDVARLVG